MMTPSALLKTKLLESGEPICAGCWSELKSDWQAQMAEVLGEAGLAVPAETPFLSTGKRGVHSEHMGFILAEMQHLQRAYPGGVW